MIRLSKSNISQTEIDAVTSVLKNEFLGMGAKVKMFEQDLSSFFGKQSSVICVCNGTAALQIALQAAGICSGDEVLIPSITYVACFQAVSALGAKPVACDVYEKDVLLNLNDAKKRLTPKTKAIMPVHYAGNPGDLDAIYAFADKHHLRVIEDASHAFGTTYQEQLIGSMGDMVCFSLDGIKNITSGEGGAIVFHDKTTFDKAKDLRLLAVEKDSEQRYQGQRSWDFDVKQQGWRYHMSDIMAAIGQVQLRRFADEFSPKRIALLAQYMKRLARFSGLQLLAMHPDASTVPHIMPIRVLGGKRNALMQHLASCDIQCGIHYKPNHLLTKYHQADIKLPVAEKLYDELLTLPLHVDLTGKEIDIICGHIANFLGE